MTPTMTVGDFVAALRHMEQLRVEPAPRPIESRIEVLPESRAPIHIHRVAAPLLSEKVKKLPHALVVKAAAKAMPCPIPLAGSTDL